VKGYIQIKQSHYSLLVSHVHLSPVTNL